MVKKSGEVGKMSIIKIDRSLIPACDVGTLQKLKQLVKQTCSVEGIGAYKIGLEIVIPFGLKKVLEEIRNLTDLPVIYDYQKAGTDIPEMGERFAKACKGVDAIILFPQAGPVTEEAWITAALNEKLKVIVGGEMTHEGYLESTGGFIANSAPKRIYEIAAKLGIKDYILPGNKPERIKDYRMFLEHLGIDPVFYSPGLVAQGGEVTESAKAAGPYWHAIVGRALYNAKSINKTAKELTKELVG